MLTHTEYQEKLRSVKTPEDAAAFAQELLAPMLAGLPKQEESEIQERPRRMGKRLTAADIVSRQNPGASPWYDIAANDKEAMVISLYAKGLTTRDIASYMKSHHGVELSQPGVSTITDKVFPLVKEWQSRPLSSCYPVMYLDGMHFKVRDGGKIVSKVVTYNGENFGTKKMNIVYKLNQENGSEKDTLVTLPGIEPGFSA